MMQQNLPLKKKFLFFSSLIFLNFSNVLPAQSVLKLIGEYPTGRQPKSAFFAPVQDRQAGGQSSEYRIFVPLLDEAGIDVFRLKKPAPGNNAPISGTALTFEKRLTVPLPSGESAKVRGFVEALIDEKRRELWVSNMIENKVHIFDLDTLNYKTSAASGGIMPKVICQNPAGDITAVSNWQSRTVALFDSDSKKQLAVINAGGTPRGMAFSPDGKLLYTAIFDAPLVAVINIAEKKVVEKFRFYEGEGAARHVIYRDGKLYVSDMYRGNVCILDAATGKLLASRRIGPNINTIVLSPDGNRIFASSRGRNNPDDYTKPGPEFGKVFMLSSADLSPLKQVTGKNQPTGLAVSPDGQYLVFTDFLDNNLEFYQIEE